MSAGRVSARIRPFVLERGRRLAPEAGRGTVLTDLLAGDAPEAIAARRGIPRATVLGIESFYDQIRSESQACDGTACRFAGGPALAEAFERDGGVGVVRCLGHCYHAPAFRSGARVFAKPPSLTLDGWLATWGEGPEEDLRPIPRVALSERRVVLRNLLGTRAAAPLADYDLPDGETILEAVAKARLRGRGGAAFQTAAKWRTARDTPAGERWVVANGDEGDPGSYVDRLLLEEDPHAVLAGMVACARAIRARRGIVYVRAEYPRAWRVVHDAVEEARGAGHLGDAFDVEVMSGAGSYVCGEETALLNSILGLRGEPRPRPPFPAEAGLHGMPTVVQNVETLAIVPWVVRHGEPTGTKAVCVSGAVERPGVVEVALGTTVRRVLDEAAGGPPAGRRWSMALVGGPMGRLLPVERFDTPLSFEGLPGMGHGGIVVLDDRVTPRALALHLFAFARAESCGSCTPCRAGTAQLERMRDRASLERVLETMETGSMCGFGLGVPGPLRDLLEHYGDRVLR